MTDLLLTENLRMSDCTDLLCNLTFSQKKKVTVPMPMLKEKKKIKFMSITKKLFGSDYTILTGSFPV